MRDRFDEQLERLNDEMIRMGSMCEEAIKLSVRALVEEDLELASKVSQMDRQIDQLETDIEALCLKLLLRQQPVAKDLRKISAALKMITDMERIGDQAEDIAEILNTMTGDSTPHVDDIVQMSEATVKMVHNSVDAYVKKDVDLAKSVIAHDDIVDRYFDSVRNDLIGIIIENGSMGEFALDLLMIAKYFERIGDHATNIAEWVVYAVTGEKITSKES